MIEESACTGECSGCSSARDCERFFDNFILPDLIAEQQKKEYLMKLAETENVHS